MTEQDQQFPAQQQQPPGLTAPMDPAPDHGESSYVGHGLLTGRRALITGGDSGIGRAVAIAYAREGADVAIVYLPEEQPDADETARWVREAGPHVRAHPDRPHRRERGAGVGRAGGHRARRPRHPGQQRRVPDGAAGIDRGHHAPRTWTAPSRPTSTRCSG